MDAKESNYVEMDGLDKGPTEVTAAAEEGGSTKEPLVDHTHVVKARRLDRFIGFLPILAFASTTLGSWEGVAAGFAAGLENGGPVVLVWGYLLAVFGALALSASIAEMASIIPVAGAQYHWTARYAPGQKNFWGLMQGWLTVFGWLASVSGLPYFNATQIEGLVILNYPDYEPKRFHGTLLMWATMCIPLFLNIYARRMLAPFEIIGMVCHLLFLPIFIVVMVCTAPRSSPSFVFTEFISGESGWENPGVCFSIGLLTATYTFTGFDGPLHMSEEVKKAHSTVPLTMVISVILNGVLAWGWMICILFTMGDIKAALGTDTGYPIIEIFYQATGSLHGTNTLVAMLMITGYVSLFGSLASVSRLVWAFARDGGLPFSKFFVYVDPKLKMPTRALGLVVMVVFLLSFVQLGSTAAFSAMISLSTLALYASYTLPIIFWTIHKIRGLPIKYGPFRMGKAGIIVNLFAIVWGVYICTFLPFPSEIPVDAESLNWAGPIFGFVMVLALVDWFVRARRTFEAPDKVMDED